MNGKLLSIFAETQMHVGIGRSESFVDLPFAREGITEYPFIPGTGIKGSLRHHFGKNIQNSPDKAGSSSDEMKNHPFKDSFGVPDSAGNVIFSDGRLLLLPVRSLSKTYFWVTCPYILERLNRDLQLLGLEKCIPVPTVSANQYVGKDHGSVVLEDREFTRTKDDGFSDIVEAIKKFIPHDSTKARLENQLIVLSDEDFKWFAKYGLMIQARNKLDENKKTSNGLWYEEWVATDTLFYSLVFTRNTEDDLLLKKIKREYVQLGGNETVGQGLCLFSEVEL